MSHPRREEVLNFALHGRGSSRDVAEHVQQCEACTEEAERQRSTIQIIREQALSESAPAPGCLDDEAVAALAGGEHADLDRERLLSHLSMCPPCRHRVAAVARALSDPKVAAEITRRREVSGRRHLSFNFALACGVLAAAAALVMVLPRIEGERGGPHRAPTAMEARPPLITPIGPVGDAKLLRWGSMAGADRYRVTLFDTSGDVLYAAETTDTSISLPDTIHLGTGRRYLWRAEARTGWDRWSGSKLGSFSITGVGRP